MFWRSTGSLKSSVDLKKLDTLSALLYTGWVADRLAGFPWVDLGSLVDDRRGHGCKRFPLFSFPAVHRGQSRLTWKPSIVGSATCGHSTD